MNDLRKSAARAVSCVRASCPLVHNITNYVTVNDCANALLAIGASPIMADDIGEAADIASISKALVINIGTLNARTIASMLAAGRRANECGIPVVLDPVGAGASKLRNDTVMELLRQIKFAVVRGNLSEVSFLAGLSVATKGVDVAVTDASNDAAAVAASVARKFSCVAVVTGAVDVVSDGTRLAKVRNGVAYMSKVTGTGCMASAVTGAFVGAVEDAFTAAVAAITAMGIAGEISYERHSAEGTGAFRTGIIDALSLLEEGTLMQRAKIDET